MNNDESSLSVPLPKSTPRKKKPQNKKWPSSSISIMEAFHCLKIYTLIPYPCIWNYSWLLNNIGLNFEGPLTCKFFSIDWSSIDPWRSNPHSMINSCRWKYREQTVVIYRFLSAWEIGAPHPQAVQGSTVLLGWRP